MLLKCGAAEDNAWIAKMYDHIGDFRFQVNANGNSLAKLRSRIEQVRIKLRRMRKSV